MPESTTANRPRRRTLPLHTQFDFWLDLDGDGADELWIGVEGCSYDTRYIPDCPGVVLTAQGPDWVLLYAASVRGAPFVDVKDDAGAVHRLAVDGPRDGLNPAQLAALKNWEIGRAHV